METLTGERPDTLSNRTSLDFHGYELLLLRKLQSDPALCMEWRDKLQKKIADEDYDLEIPHSLWFLTVTLVRKKDRLLQFVQKQQEQAAIDRRTRRICLGETLLTRYLHSHMFTELHLDGIYKYGDDNTLPQEIFRCPSITWLSMKYNYLDRIPPDIGQMANLEHLALTNNKLQNKSIPYTLIFCHHLRTLLLDNNLLDALPGFLLKMPSLETVHRHGNHNYFKSTFMWYHTDVNERILSLGHVSDFMMRQPEMLQFWAAQAIIGSKLNFYRDPSVAPVLRDYITSIYTMFNVCVFCNTAKLLNQAGYKVITFKNPYLGNTCVPFQHWACSLTCAMGVEIPARHEQIAAAQELDREYDSYVESCQKQYRVVYTSSGVPHRRRTIVPHQSHGCGFNQSCHCVLL
ncbi:hypothetical protein LSAT2_019995 [Lamellibrachia satsuma]|nr:hypothetical protein LSAT2_019995 [Lamellibrachia satsuma]